MWGTFATTDSLIYFSPQSCELNEYRHYFLYFVHNNSLQV